MQVLSFLFSLLAQCSIAANIKMSELTNRNGQELGVNKLVSMQNNQTADMLELDKGWYKFFFGGPLLRTAYSFAFDYPDYVQISITDAYCSGDSFDLFRNGSYLVTTPRVRSDGCSSWTDDPDQAFVNPKFSSTKFMLPPNFNLSIGTLDSPFNGGAGFIRIDTFIGSCPIRVSNITLVTALITGHDNMARICERVGGVPLDVTFSNSMSAASLLSQCGYTSAWINKVSLAAPVLKRRESSDLGCIAFSASDPSDPTVEVMACDSPLPVLCQLA